MKTLIKSILLITVLINSSNAEKLEMVDNIDDLDCYKWTDEDFEMYEYILKNRIEIKIDNRAELHKCFWYFKIYNLKD